MDYPTALAYLQSLTRFGVNLGLSRMEKLLDELGNPHLDGFFIHVGGTNGKGSVCALLSQILQTSGLKVGLFTSPHLERYTERFQINGVEIPETEAAQILTRMQPILEQMVAGGFEHPTEFEVSTAMALVYFQAAQVDVAILEVGLGGDLDATNVVLPRVSVITSVSYDHENVLGSSLAEIARSKAGIIKPGVPLVTAVAGEAWNEISRVAYRENVPVVRVFAQPPEVKRDYRDDYRSVWVEPTQQIRESLQNENVQEPFWGQMLQVKGLQQKYPDLSLSLLGAHQMVNAATALAVIELLQETGMTISKEDIYQGMESTTWPGRLEIICRKPLVLLDGAHNPASATQLANFIATTLGAYRVILLMGILADKDRQHMVQELAPLADKIMVTRPCAGSRGEDWTQVAALAEEYTNQVFLQEDLTEALLTTLRWVQEAEDDRPTMICATGSLFLIGAIRHQFQLLPNKKTNDGKVGHLSR